MKRDMDLIRELMLKLESLPMSAGDLTHIPPDHPAMAMDGKTPVEIDFHLGLLCDAFFIDPGDYSPMGGIWFRKLTWSGYDFLDSVRDPAIWRETKEGVKKAGGFTVDIVVAVGKFLIKEKLKQLGIDIG